MMTPEPLPPDVAVETLMVTTLGDAFAATAEMSVTADALLMTTPCWGVTAAVC